MEDAAGVLNPIQLFMQAGPIGKSVILMLLAASIWCWVLIIESAWGVARLRKAIAASRGQSQGTAAALLAPVAEAGRQAASLSIPGESLGEARARVTEAMSRAAQHLLNAIEGGLPNLAVISSVAPFVGLFGTVWGIMASFSAIATAKDTSLAVVAPGIAEALAATAIGLAAAIPATIGYNRIGSSLARAGQALQHLIEEDAVTLTAHPAARREPAGETK
ncbi:MAG: MotA/TolQ/ExbB proton channel family protein [Xanthobacteraceae bacterium]|nr:MotA/TolQ/ExbB proton channel family protein [Xanthobacteraceae bacterium]